MKQPLKWYETIPVFIKVYTLQNDMSLYPLEKCDFGAHPLEKISKLPIFKIAYFQKRESQDFQKRASFKISESSQLFTIIGKIRYEMYEMIKTRTFEMAHLGSK